MTSAVEHGLRVLFRRCVQCPPQAPSCVAPCPDGQLCTLVPPDCTKCAHMICLPDPSPAPPSSSGPNIGAIAGGVAGGVAFVSIVVFFIWLFWIKKRRAQQDQELEDEWEHDEIAHQKRTTQFAAMQHDAASTRTRGSLANSILSRASNFIQIAYIPGVTNRNGSARNSLHAPVPPVPAAYRNGPGKPTSPLSNEGDALFFGIDDLRGSTYSRGSSIQDTRQTSNRDTRYTVNSITPSLARDSVASDVQWDDATTTPMPATTITKVAPRMVSVKSSSASSKSPTPESGSASETPPEHVSDRVNEVPVMIASQGPSPNSSIRAKPTQVTVGSNKTKGRFPIRQTSEASSSTTTTTSTKPYAPLIPSPLAENDSELEPDSDSHPHTHAQNPLLPPLDFATPSGTIQPTESPFFDTSDLPSAAIAAASSTRPNPYASMASTIGAAAGSKSSPRRMSGRGGSKGKIAAPLSAVIEEATKRASADTSASASASKDPFGDENEVLR